MTTHEPWSIWQMRDGTPIRVIDMELSHLMNARNMMERNLGRLVAKIVKTRGDTAVLEQKRDFCLEWINAFSREIIRRGAK